MQEEHINIQKKQNKVRNLFHKEIFIISLDIDGKKYNDGRHYVDWLT